MPTALTRELTRFVSVNPATGTRQKAVDALIVGAVTMAVLSLLFGPALALMGFTGIALSVSAYDRSQRSRLRVLSRLSGVYLLVVAIGACASMLPAWLGAIVLALLSTAIAFGYHALLSDPPGPMLLIMGTATALYIPTLGVPIPVLLLVTAVSMLIACTASLLLQFRDRRAAVERQLEVLRAAVDELESASPPSPAADLATAELGVLRDRAYAALFAAQSSLVASKPRGQVGGPTYLAIEDEIHSLHRRLAELITAEELAWTKVSPRAFSDHYLGAPRERYMLRWALSSASPAWLAARRTGVAVLIAGEFSTLMGFTHPYWSMMTAALVFSTAADRISTAHRAGHRVVGTLIGLALFLGIHALNPSPYLVAGIVVVCLSVTQSVAPRQYALATMVMTPMPLLLASMQGAPTASLLSSRLLETVVGAVAAMLVLWLPGRSTSIVLVRRQFRRALRAADLALQRMRDDASSSASITARRNLHFEQLAAAKVLALALADQPETLAGWRAVEAALNELNYTILTAARTTDPARVLRWAAMSALLEDYLASLPPVSGHDIDTAATAQALHDVLAIGRPVTSESIREEVGPDAGG